MKSQWHIKIWQLLAPLIICFNQSHSYADATVFFNDPQNNHFELIAPFSKLTEIKKNPNIIAVKNFKFDGFIAYQSGEKKISLPVEVSIKGFSSIMGCAFPKLELKIRNTNGTLFAGIKKIDLNTHCDDTPKSPALDSVIVKSMRYPHREVLIYRLINILGLDSFLTKPIFMKYTDSDTQQSPIAASANSYAAFFIEGKSQFIKRNQFLEIKAAHDTFKVTDLADKKTSIEQYQFKSVQQSENKIDRVVLAKIELLQNLIFNNDWYIKPSESEFRFNDPNHANELWNIKLFQTNSGQWLPIAQDFNFSFIGMSELSGVNTALISVERKFFNMLNPAEKESLVQELSLKKGLLLQQTDLIKNDPEFSKISTYLQKRIDFIRSQLK